MIYFVCCCACVQCMCIYLSMEEIIKSMSTYSTFKPSLHHFCKIVIYNYVFVGFYSMPNLIVIMFNLMYPVFHVGFICKGCVRERECVKTQGN